MKADLTDALVAGMEKGDEIYDTTVPGLLVRRGAERASFMVVYTAPDGQRRRPQIAEEGVATVAQARQIAREWLLAVLGGKDPKAERDRAREAPTVAALWGAVASLRYPGCETKAWHREARRLYETHIGPTLGGHKVGSLTYDDFAKIHTAMKATPTQANRVMAVATVIMDEAERQGWRPIGSNPVALVRRYPEKSRSRYADHDELRRLLSVLRLEIAPGTPERRHALYVLTVMVTGARPSEAQAMPWLSVDPGFTGPFIVYDVTGDANEDAGKTGFTRIALPTWLARMIGSLDRGGYEAGPFHCLDYRAFWERLCEQAEVEELWLRDLRRTFATLAYDLDRGKDEVGDTLNHASLQTTNVYAKLSNQKRFSVVGAVSEQVISLLTVNDGSANR